MCVKLEEIRLNSKYYPNKLRKIYDPPKKIYVLGNKQILNSKSIAIIGCRDYSEYGKIVAQKFAYELAKRKIVIVSGLARGIDTFAHIGSIFAKEKTIAVLGSSFDNIYPKENIKVVKKIVELGGCVLSEYPLGSKTGKKNFVQRNRIISGLSDGVLVIEAKEKSGTLTTVDFALEQGRDVFCIPGNITSINSYATNELIKQGAKLINRVEDILEELNLD